MTLGVSLTSRYQMKDTGFSLNAESVFGPAKNGAIVSSGVQTVDQLQRGHKIVNNKEKQD